jgi:hypothetical protein
MFVRLDSLTLDPNNARKHSQRNIAAIAGSLEKFGQRKPIVVHGNKVIAGNGTVEAARSLGWVEIDVARVPDDWSDDQAMAYALADNRSAELAEWDDSVLADQLLALTDKQWDVTQFGFDNVSGGDSETFDSDKYTKSINIPHYEIVGEQPGLAELVDMTKVNELASYIHAADIPDDVRDFLLTAAMRHAVFDYRKIAEFYPHTTPEIQELMEQSALIIIDFDNAIRNGYVRFVSKMNELIQGAEDAG